MSRTPQNKKESILGPVELAELARADNVSLDAFLYHFFTKELLYEEASTIFHRLGIVLGELEEPDLLIPNHAMGKALEYVHNNNLIDIYIGQTLIRAIDPKEGLRMVVIEDKTSEEKAVEITDPDKVALLRELITAFKEDSEAIVKALTLVKATQDIRNSEQLAEAMVELKEMLKPHSILIVERDGGYKFSKINYGQF